jgi:uncharacterized protein
LIKKNKKIIIKKHRLLDKNSFKQAFGLMFFSRRKFNFGLIFDREKETIIGSSIHMFFVFFSINVIFLDSKQRIVDIKKRLRPFTLYVPKRKARYIIELPLKTSISSLKIGDKLDWS